MSQRIEFPVIVEKLIQPIGSLKYEAKVVFAVIYEEDRGRRVPSKDRSGWSMQHGETELEASKKAVAAAKEKYLKEQTG